ncbi:ABC transporter, substrate-binding protein (cluster 4, leucine/isoleucine/valine/benzoate), partial [hydrothermal vent metagenome]
MVTCTKFIPLPIMLCLLFIFGHYAVAEDRNATTQKTITLGTTTALTGPAKSLGLAMVRGMNAHLETVNESGGINGHRFELITLDDGYHRQSAHMQMTKLIKNSSVLAVIGNVGTPTAQETVPLANRYKIPLIGAFTGANLLRKPTPDRFVINYRASYDEEMAMVVDALLDNNVSAERIAFFTQND